MKPSSTIDTPSWQLCVAPMMDWTDRHCRYFHRLLAPHARLYTEMITTGALLRGDRQALLNFDSIEHPLALQLGGNDPAALAQCAIWAAERGFDEVNLNCGCPSSRVQQGAFGACLMQTPKVVAQSVAAMRNACDLPITVKHRIGVDRQADYAFVRDFVGIVAEAGCDVFIVHARAAWLDGLSPRENRTVPPLKYEFVYQLQKDFPALRFVLNGGVTDKDAATRYLPQVAGIMLGRAAYHQPRLLQELSTVWWPATPVLSLQQIVAQMSEYCSAQLKVGVPVHAVSRHMLGLLHGQPGGRHWRRTLSEGNQQAIAPDLLFARALAIMMNTGLQES